MDTHEKDVIHMLGEKEIKVDGYNNIHIDNVVFKGTPGLWRLIMMNKPEIYTADELRDYKELVDRTNVIQFPHTTKPSDRPTITLKYTFLTELYEEKSKEKEGEDESDDESEEESDTENLAEEKEGTGVYFLPGDINGLIKQLHLLLAEFRAGNKSATIFFCIFDVIVKACIS